MAENVQLRNDGCFELSGLVSVDTVGDYRESLVELISASSVDEVEVELGKLEIQGSAVIVLLISIVRECRSLAKSVVFLHCSEELRAIASACGVDEILNLK